MQTRKKLARARRHMLADSLRAPAVRASLSSVLGRIAEQSPDGDCREAAARALAVLREGGWCEEAWQALGVPGRIHYARPLPFASLDRLAP